MDQNNLRNLLAQQPNGSKALIRLVHFTPSLSRESFNSSWILVVGGQFGDFGSSGEPIQDPYYGGAKGFDKTYEACVRNSEGLLKYLDLDSSNSNKAAL